MTSLFALTPAAFVISREELTRDVREFLGRDPTRPIEDFHPSNNRLGTFPKNWKARDRNAAPHSRQIQGTKHMAREARGSMPQTAKAPGLDPPLTFVFGYYTNSISAKPYDLPR
jgi:hypothetical protein